MIPDPDQRAVIEASPDSFLLVAAPPGAGKTAVACARIAWLAQNGTPPSRILMISFTQVAVAEFRERIARMAADVPDIRGVEITTLDAYVWRLLKGFAEDHQVEDLFGSYDQNIATTTQKLSDGEPTLTRWLQQFQHIVIDEAQDLVGPRAQLVAAILQHRSPSSGATVFADEAQAIYGFTSDEEAGVLQDTFFEVIHKVGLKPERRELRTIHRTNNPRLKGLFLESRKPLADHVAEPQTAYSGARSSIEEFADNEAGDFDAVVDTLRGTSALVLFRTRAQVLMASSLLHHKHKIPHRLRMSGLPKVIEPWIGFLLSDFCEPDLTEGQFHERWANRASHPCLQLHGRNVDTAWRALQSLAPGRRGSVALSRLRAVLARSKTPVDVSVAEIGSSGPTLGTIHASKGREANQVVLMMPRDSSEVDDDSSLLEEGRVLYVGATRAIDSLAIGESFQCRASSLDDGRVFRLVNHNAQVEFGREGDVLVTSPVARTIQRDEAECRQSQEWLAQHAAEPADIGAACIGTGDWAYRLTVNETMRIGCLSPQVNNDLFEVAKRLKLGRVCPPSKLKHLWIAGVGTTSLAPGDPRLDELHEPYSRTGLLLTPIIRGFPTVFFAEARQQRNNW
ncbi:MAG: ATP-dependent helicase [Planctomycetes bacterium]|nr:ATP-dependent helicase [Planctomycetota bacterium]